MIDVAGEVVELGPGVSTFKVGEKILGLLDFTVKPSELLQLSLFFSSSDFPSSTFEIMNLIDDFRIVAALQTML